MSISLHPRLGRITAATGLAFTLALAPGFALADDEPATEDLPEVVTIADIQGTGDASPLVGKTVTTTGIVTALQGRRGGFIVQMPTADVPEGHTGSSAVFVRYGEGYPDVLKAWDRVTVTGVVSEQDGLTTLTANGTDIVRDTVGPHLDKIVIPSLSVPHSDAEAEARESMIFSPSGNYRVVGNDELIYTGRLILTDGGRPALQPTQAGRPGSPEAQEQADYNAAHRVVLDDANDAFFDVKYGQKEEPVAPKALPYLSTTEPGPTLGATVTFNLPVVMRQMKDGWVVDPVDQDTSVAVTFSAVREDKPADVGGNFRVATFNVLNYFSDLGVDAKDVDKEGKPLCQPTMNLWDHSIPVAGNWDCPRRGAWDAAGLKRQEDKIVNAINQLGTAGADVVALQEIENGVIFGDDIDVALKHLVDALNAADPAQGWAYVPSPTTLPEYGNKDMIRQAFIYKPATVTLTAPATFLDDPAYQSAADARAPIAQAFTHVATGRTALVINNHLTYKGGKVVGDDNANPGDTKGAAWDVGRNNGDRTRQSKALATFAASEAERLGAELTLLVGDFNSYAYEDPIVNLTDAGYHDLMNTDTHPSQHSTTDWNEYTYSYNATFGSLDHVMLNEAAHQAMTGFDVWAANAYESKALEYSRFMFTGTDYYRPDVFRASDHNAAIVGFALTKKPEDTTPTPGDPEKPGDEAKPGDNSKPGKKVKTGKPLAHTGDQPLAVLAAAGVALVVGAAGVVARRRLS